MTIGREDLTRELGAELSILLAAGRSVLSTSTTLFHPDIQPAAYQLAATLYGHGPAKAGRLAELLGMDKSAVSRLAKSLCDNGLAQASADPEDGRAILYSLTDGGHERMRAASAAKSNAFFSRLAGWSDTELAQFSKLLRKFNRA
jgi:DNA-binding MarR family transcriptional regulator